MDIKMLCIFFVFLSRFSSHVLSELCHLVSSELVKYGIPIRGIPIISRAIR